jgi:hypothetical protein
MATQKHQPYNDPHDPVPVFLHGFLLDPVFKLLFDGQTKIATSPPSWFAGQGRRSRSYVGMQVSQ